MKRFPVPPVGDLNTFHSMRRVPHGWDFRLALRELRRTIHHRREVLEEVFYHVASELADLGYDPVRMLQGDEPEDDWKGIIP